VRNRNLLTRYSLLECSSNIQAAKSLGKASETSSVDKVEVPALAHAAGLAEIAAKEAVDQARLATAIASGKAP